MASWTADLTVRPVPAGETARFGQILEEHHWLGARLFGSVVRHVAVLDGAWVALLGYGSAVLRCTARDTVIGWSEADRLDRLPLLAGQQRFCVLPGGRPQLASAVLARSLARLPGDFLDLHNQIVLAAETFTDPARHTGACYAAAGFACAGPTAGYARGAGGRGYAFHGQVKRCWLREVHRGGLAALGAVAPSVLFGPPAPSVWLDLPAAHVASLRAHLEARLHAAGFGQQALSVFGARWSPRSGGYLAPSESSFRRFLHGLPPGALGAAIGSWLAGQADAGSLDARRARRLAARLAAAAPAVR